MGATSLEIVININALKWNHKKNEDVWPKKIELLIIYRKEQIYLYFNI